METQAVRSPKNWVVCPFLDIAHHDADAYRALLQQAFADAG
jgi:hypothetical protein